jgi:2-polyprenyl-3-methyl-5-hydroxy-6-metoxy-1,4-benzoquinol methylase
MHPGREGARGREGFSWSRLNEARRAVRARWPTIWRLPITGRSTRYAAARIAKGERVLDFGASDGRFGRRLAEGVVYLTLDTDPEVKADYRSLAEVEPGTFDAVTCFETIEHLTLPEACDLLAGARSALRPGGRLYVSTPNIHHPWAYLRSATHRTPFCYDELGGLIGMHGFALEAILRCHRDAVPKALARLLAYPLYRVIGVDWAKSILAVARRPP